MQFDSSHLEGNISEVRVTTLELKAELSKNNQRIQALTQRLETLERRPLARTMTRKESMGRPPSSALPSAATSSPISAAALPVAPTTEPAATAAGGPIAVAPGSSSPTVATGPSVNFAVETKPAQGPSPSPATAAISKFRPTWCHLQVHCIALHPHHMLFPHDHRIYRTDADAGLLVVFVRICHMPARV